MQYEINADIIDILAFAERIRIKHVFDEKPDNKKYHDYSFSRNTFFLYMKRWDGLYDYYEIKMLVDDHSIVPVNTIAEKIVNSADKIAQLQESIEKNTKSGLLEKLLTMHMML